MSSEREIIDYGGILCLC